MALAVSLIFSLAMAETFLRVAAPQPVGLSWLSPDGLWLHAPGLEATYRRSEFAVRVRFNSRGFRGGEWATPKPPDVLRVLVLGDSFAEGLQVNEPDLFTTRLERAFEGSSPRVEVLNAGVSGMGTGDEIALFDLHGAALAPDLVIVAFCLQNDTMNDVLGGRCRLDGAGTAHCDPIPRPSARSLALAHGRSWIASRSHFYQLVRAAVVELPLERMGLRTRPPEGDATMPFADDRHLLPPPAYLVEGDRLSQALLAQLDARTRAIGAPLWAVPLPIRAQVDSALWPDVARQFPGRELLRDAPQRAFAAGAEALRIPVVDPYDAFRAASDSGDPPFWQLDAHFTPTGHRLVAEALAARLRSDPRLRPGKDDRDGTMTR